MNNHYGLVINMETRILPELVLSRKVCASCGEGTYEFDPDISVMQRYTCPECQT
jgi:predicted Zn-ribbon and HTH transcriptional regulator